MKQRAKQLDVSPFCTTGCLQFADTGSSPLTEDQPLHHFLYNHELLQRTDITESQVTCPLHVHRISSVCFAIALATSCAMLH